MKNLEEILDDIDSIFKSEAGNCSVFKMHDDIVAFCRSHNDKPSGEIQKCRLYSEIGHCVSRYLGTVLTKYGDSCHSMMRSYNDEWKIFKTKRKTLCTVLSYFEINWLCELVRKGTPGVLRLHNLCLQLWEKLVFNRVIERILIHTTDVIMTNSYGRNESIEMRKFQKYCLELCAVARSSEEEIGYVYPTIYMMKVRRPLLENITARYESMARTALEIHPVAEYFKEVLGWYGFNTDAPIGVAGDRIEHAMDLGITSAHKTVLLDVCQAFLSGEVTSASINVSKLSKVSPESLAVIKGYLVENLVINCRAAISRLCVIGTEEYIECFVQFLLSSTVGLIKLDVLRDAFIVLSEENSGIASAAEILASLCDECLRAKNENFDFVSLTVSLLNHCVDKFEFLRFYIHKFVPRQLDYGSQDLHAEADMLVKLSALYEKNYLFVLKTMLKDLHTSKTDSLQFCSYLETNKLLGSVRVETKILTAGIWRLPCSSFVMPLELRTHVEEFERYFRATHRGRKLIWAHNLSKGVLEVTPVSGHTFNVHLALPQLAIMLMFQNTDTLGLDEVAQKLEIKPNVLGNSMCGLLRSGLIRKNIDDSVDAAKSKQIAFNTTYRALQQDVSIDYNNVCLENKIGLAAGSPEEDKNYVCQAAIVRFAKIRRQCIQDELVEGVKASLHNKITATDEFVMKNVCELVRKEYLSVDGVVYNYIP